MIRLLFVLVAFFTTQLHAETLKVAVTTSFHNSGLSEVLLPAIKSDTSLDVQLLVVGTGQAIRLGEAGDVDAILVHSKKAEEAFVASGYGVHRREIMYNDFVLIGPSSDPSDIKSADNTVDALQRIAANQDGFVSRGDESGTHKKELSLWLAANLDPREFGRWYNAVGAGMGGSLNTASGLDAYIMSDRGSWLNFGNKGNLELLFSGDPILFNQYAFIQVNSERHSHVNSSAAEKLENWLVSSEAQELINSFEIKGEKPFVFNGSP